MWKVFYTVSEPDTKTKKHVPKEHMLESTSFENAVKLAKELKKTKDTTVTKLENFDY